MDNFAGNITTIGKIIAMPIAGWFIGICVAYGINLPVDQQTLSEVVFAAILLVWGLLDAKLPNSLGIFGNSKKTIDTEERVLNDEYECDIDEEC
jgi:flagellar motor component MotA